VCHFLEEIPRHVLGSMLGSCARTILKSVGSVRLIRLREISLEVLQFCCSICSGEHVVSGIRGHGGGGCYDSDAEGGGWRGGWGRGGMRACYCGTPFPGSA